MTTPADTSTEHPIAKRGSDSAFAIGLTALCSSICMSLAFGLVFGAFAVAAESLFGLGETFLYVTGAIVGAVTLWLFVWCLGRSLHVERRLRAGLDIDQPDWSIGANFRSTPTPSA